MPLSSPAAPSSSAPKSGSDHNIPLGIACVLGAVFLFAASDGVAKWLGGSYGSGQVTFLRYLFGFLPVGFLLWRHGFSVLRTKKPGLHLLRGLLNGSALLLFFEGLRHLPLAEAICIGFTAPLFVTALSRPVLGEAVGPRRWAAVLVGFIGALIILQPGTEAFQPAALFILSSAICFAFLMLLTRRMTRSEHNVALFSYSTLVACVILSPLAWWQWQPVDPGQIWGFAFLGLVGGSAAFLMIRAYRHGPAAVIAPFDYSALIWGALWGWIFWDDVPGSSVWLGAILIALAGAYIARRETRKQG